MYNYDLFFNEQYEIKGKQFDNQIKEWSTKYKSLMTIEQKRFLMSVIVENKIKNVLEIGIFNGVSSLCILKAGLSNYKDFNLYGIDVNSDKNFVGQAVYGFCDEEEIKHYHINIGKTSFNIEDIVPKDIKFDLIFIDAAHHHPFPIFDLILSIPYIHQDSIILLHDVINYFKPHDWGGSFIFESWKGDKYRIFNNESEMPSSMGCIKLPKTKEELYNNIKTIANIPFKPIPWGNLEYYKSVDIIDDSLRFNMDTLKNLKTIMEKYYPEDFTNEIYNMLKNNYEEYKKNSLLYIHEQRFIDLLYENIIDTSNPNNLYNKLDSINNKLNKLINMLTWCIPIKKVRENIRKKLN